MLTVKRPKAALPTEGSQIAELRDSIRVLSEVLRHLAERVELLEAQQSLVRFRPVEG
jgi:hypothetical protein